HRADPARGRQAGGAAAPRVGRAGRDRDGAGSEGRHRLQRDEAGDARDRRGRPGAAVRERRRPSQGRPARGALHLARVAVSAPRRAAFATYGPARLGHPEPTTRCEPNDDFHPRVTRERAGFVTISPHAGTLTRAAIRDGAGFACLEVSGGGVFDAAVRRGVETPWERIRALKARTTTPLGIALRGRFLVGSRPVSGDIVRRFVSSAAENGIDVFRLHDPLNDVSNLREAGEAITGAGKAFHAGLVYSPGRSGEAEALVEQARKLPDLGATRVIV